MQGKHPRVIVRSTTDSVARLAKEKSEFAATMNSRPAKDSLDRAVKPKSIAQGAKKVGMVLCASPDPISDIPGAALIAASFILKRREPAGIEHLAKETRRMMRDFESLSL